MNPRVKAVSVAEDFQLLLTFESGERKIFDVKPYLNIGVFKELKDKNIFNSVRINMGSISWKNGQDLCPDTLYLDGKNV